MQTPILDLIAAKRAAPKAPANTNERAEGGDSFSLFLKDSAAVAEGRTQPSLQSHEAQSAEKHERRPTADRRASDSIRLDESHNSRRRSEQPASETLEPDSKATTAAKPPVATQGEQAESAPLNERLDAGLGELSDATATVVDPTFKAVLPINIATTMAPPAGIGTATVATVSEVAVTEVASALQPSQPTKLEHPTPRAAANEGEPAPTPMGGQSDAKPLAKSPVAVAVANQAPVSKPTAVPIVDEARLAPVDSDQPVAVTPNTAAKGASDVATVAPAAHAPAVQAIAAQARLANAEASRPAVRSQAKLDSAPPQAGDDDSMAMTQPSRAVTAPATSSGIEQTAAARRGTGDGTGPAAGKAFSAEMPPAVGHGPAQGAGFVQALDRAQPHANTDNGVATGRMEPSEQIAIQVQRALGTGRDRVSIQLHPAELGRIEVKLDMSADNTMRVAVSVDKPETLDLLQRDARSLDRALQDAGIKTDSGSLSFDLRQQADNRQLGRHHQAYAPANDRSSNESVPSDAAEAASQRQAWHAGSVDLNV